MQASVEKQILRFAQDDNLDHLCLLVYGRQTRICHFSESDMNHDHSLTSSSSPFSFFENYPEGGHLLQAGHIHVWRAIVDVPSTRLQVYQDTLSPDEQERAQRFRAPQHRQRFTAARGILRHILARYLRQSPREIHFESGAFGKPCLQDPAERSLHFNVSHSGQWAVYAVSRDLEVGIDLEEDRDSLDYAGLAERICSPEELTVFQNLSQTEQRAAFFRCWTRKEAFVKALGHGFSFPLQNVTVTFTSDDPPRILNLQRNLSETDSLPEDWSLFNLPLGQGFLGALAVAGRPSLIRGWDYRPDD